MSIKPNHARKEYRTMTEKQISTLVTKIRRSDRHRFTVNNGMYCMTDSHRLFASCEPFAGGTTFERSAWFEPIVNNNNDVELIDITKELYARVKQIVKESGKRNPAIIRIGYGKNRIYVNSLYLLDTIEWCKDGRSLPECIEIYPDGFDRKTGIYKYPMRIKEGSTVSIVLPVFINNSDNVVDLF